MAYHIYEDARPLHGTERNHLLPHVSATVSVGVTTPFVCDYRIYT